MGVCTFSRALGAGGVLPNGDQFDGTYNQYRVVRGMLTFSTSYATGGDTIPLATIGLREVYTMLIDPRLGLNASGMSMGLNTANPLAPVLVAFDANNTEVANGTNLSTRLPTPVWFLGY